MTAQKYEIRVTAGPEFEWADRFEDVQILLAGENDFILRAMLPDEPALHGLLGRIRSAGMILVSVGLIPFGQPGENG